MSLEQAILEAVRTLPPDKQREVTSMPPVSARKTRSGHPSRAVAGSGPIWAYRFSAEEIDENQREMWRGFPRDDV
jgi:hypothetical protein